MSPTETTPVMFPTKYGSREARSLDSRSVKCVTMNWNETWKRYVFFFETTTSGSECNDDSPQGLTIAMMDDDPAKFKPGETYILGLAVT